MNLTKQDILSGIQTLPRSKDVQVADELLHSPDTVFYDPLIGGKLSHERTVARSEIICTWSARLNNSIKMNKNLYGCSDFVKSLNEMPDETKLIGLCFRNQKMTGKFWVAADTEKLIGFVVVEKDADV